MPELPEAALNPGGGLARRLAVLAVWVALSLAALWLVWHFGHNFPWYDEWLMVPLLDGSQPLDPAWLWEPRNDHRIPVPKLVLLALYELSGWDFRVGMYANVILCSVAALLLMRAVASGDRGISAADAFFPLILLHWGHYENFLWSWQVTQVLPVVIVLLILATMVRHGTSLARPAAFCAAPGVLALPLSGIPGLAYAPALALWLSLAAWRSWNSGEDRRRNDARLMWCAAGATVLLVPVYFIGLETSVHARPDLMAIVATMAVFLEQGLLPPSLSGLPYATTVVALVFVATSLLLVSTLFTGDPCNRDRAASLLLFAGAYLSLALAVGVARPGTEFAARYVLQAVPAWCWVYAVWHVAAPTGAARAAKFCLASAALVAGVEGAVQGFYKADHRHALAVALEADLAKGIPPSLVLARHQRAFFPFPEDGGASYHDWLADNVLILGRTGKSVFRSVEPEPQSNQLVSIDTLASHSTEGPTSTWAFAAPVDVAGLRLLKPSGDTGAAGNEVRVLWKRSSSDPESPDRRLLHWWSEGDTFATVWIHAPVTEVRVDLIGSDSALRPGEMFVILGGADHQDN